MNNKFRIVAGILIVVLFIAVGACSGISAAEKPDIPEFTIKRTKNGTGIKVKIEKTYNVDYYDIYVYDVDTLYTGYESRTYKTITLNVDGSKIRNYTIDNLPAGKYKVGVSAYKYEYINENGSSAYGSDYYIKPITIKAIKTKEKEREIPDFSKCKVGDIVVFGSYEQDGNLTNGKEPLEWVVLSKSKSSALLLSKYIIEAMPYNSEFMPGITWSNCSLREWLNKKFYSVTFNKKEKALIKKMKISNSDNEKFGTEGGIDTKDKIFLLSTHEVYDKMFGDIGYDVYRRCAATEFAKIRGVETNENNFDKYWFDPKLDLSYEGKAISSWLLRSPGDYESNKCGAGGSRDWGMFSISTKAPIRPALYVKIE